MPFGGRGARACLTEDQNGLFFRGMKQLCAMGAGLVMALGLTGCSSTNDRGVNINHSTDLFNTTGGNAAAPHYAVATKGERAGAGAEKKS